MTRAIRYNKPASLKRGINMKRIYWFSALLITLLAIMGCSPKPAVEVKPAPIHEVDIRFAESAPVQVFVYIKGGLSDGCTTFNEVKTTRNDTIITIEVLVQRPQNRMCTQIYGYFEQNVALGTNFVSGRTYTVIVNDFTKTFVMQ